MAEYQYIKVALRDSIDGVTQTVFSYPSGLNPAEAGFSAMVEPAPAIKRFMNATECYVLQSTRRGHYISLIARPEEHPEHGWMMVSVLVDNGDSLTGRQAVRLLEELRRTLIDSQDFREEAVDIALMQADVPRLPVALRSWEWRQPSADDDSAPAEAAYRTFVSPSELQAIFAFPGQPEYDGYRCILVVPASTSLRPGVKMPRITAPVKKQYSIVCPEGVTSSSETAYDGDKVTLTYTKEGYIPVEESVVAGQPGPYASLKGATMEVRTARQTGMRFVRHVGMNVTDAKGAPVKGFTITVNGRNVNTMKPYVELTERDLPEDGDVEIKVESTGFHPMTLAMTTAELLATDNLDLKLMPVEQTVMLRLDFGHGRIIEQELSMGKNTPEYTRLHAGSFHGFRAYRQSTQDKSEVYNVDLRTQARTEQKAVQAEDKPAAPAAAAEEPAKAVRQAPKFENVSDEASEPHPFVDATLPTDPRKPHAGEDSDDELDEEASPASRRKYIRAGLGVVAALLIGLGSWWAFSGGASADASAVSADEAADSAAVATGQDAPAAVRPATPEEQADIDYLNSNASWTLSRLQSPMGKALAQAIADGDLRGLAENDYFAVRGRCTNAEAGEIVRMAWTAIGSPNQNGNARRLRDAAKQPDIHLRKLMESMAKVRPSENPNTAPMPQK